VRPGRTLQLRLPLLRTLTTPNRRKVTGASGTHPTTAGCHGQALLARVLAPSSTGKRVCPCHPKWDAPKQTNSAALPSLARSRRLPGLLIAQARLYGAPAVIFVSVVFGSRGNL